VTQYGVTVNGFVAKQQATIASEINASFQASFGSNINLLPESVLGQLRDIFAEREALIWQLAEAVYDSQYPSGAEGTSVDNVLALNGLRRIGATPTTASLVLLGTVGTVIPQGSLVGVPGTTSQFSTDAAATIAAAIDAVQTLLFSNIPTSGGFELSIVDPEGNTLTTANIPWNATPYANQIQTLTFGSTPVTGAFTIKIGSLTTSSIAYTASAANVQTAVQALSGYSSATVTGSFAGGFTITLPNAAQPVITTPTNTLGVSITVSSLQSVQSAINALTDPSDSSTPYSDVTVTGNFTTGFIVTFGGGTSGSKFQNPFTVPANTLQNGSNFCNITVVQTTVGAPAEATTTCTCTATGPTAAPANSITSILSPVSGWTGVNNPLDALTGANIESDTAALIRRGKQLASNSKGPLSGIVGQVLGVTGVTQVVGFENLTNETDDSTQFITFSLVPSSGSCELQLGGSSGQISASIPYSAAASDVQTAINALSGYSGAIVTGNFSTGFIVAFGGGFETQPLAIVLANSLLSGSTPVTTAVSGDIPAKSFEIVVEGGANQDIANAIGASKPAGIASYGTTGPLTYTDQYGFPHDIYFSRPIQVPIYVKIDITGSLDDFPATGALTIQNDILAIGNALAIGQDVIVYGTNGLAGAFNSVTGITRYTIAVGTATNPTLDDNISIQPEQVAQFESYNVQIVLNLT
jgi:uncharacterized phage protein gp47/JayE